MPFLNIPEILKLDPTLCYSQPRVGLLILMFQALVAIPSLTTIRYFLKNHSVLQRQEYEYVVDGN